jgi:hypothetical protein
MDFHLYLILHPFYPVFGMMKAFDYANHSYNRSSKRKVYLVQNSIK